MTYNTPIIIKYNLNTVNRVNCPTNLYISSIKIKNIRIYPKIISKNKLSLYGVYEVVILYNFFIPKDKSKYFYKTYKCLINKTIFLPHSKLVSKINYDISITSVDCPICRYKLRESNNYAFSFNYNNLCSIRLSVPLQLALTPRVNCNHPDIYEYNPYNVKISPSYYCNSPLPNTIKKISTNIIIAHGYEDFFINERFTIPPSSPKILDIYKINIELLFSKLTPISDYIIVSGSYQISITYKTNEYIDCNESKGSLNYVYYLVPFNNLIHLKLKFNHTSISCTDKAEVLDYNCLGTTFNLYDKFSNCDEPLLYSSINIQSVFRLHAIVTHEEDILI